MPTPPFQRPRRHCRLLVLVFDIEVRFYIELLRLAHASPELHGIYSTSSRWLGLHRRKANPWRHCGGSQPTTTFLVTAQSLDNNFCTRQAEAPFSSVGDYNSFGNAPMPILKPCPIWREARAKGDRKKASSGMRMAPWTSGRVPSATRRRPSPIRFETSQPAPSHRSEKMKESAGKGRSSTAADFTKEPQKCPCCINILLA